MANFDKCADINNNPELVRKVWKKARSLPGFDPNQTRQDVAGARIDYDGHGNRDSQFGWEIDHKKPVARGGTDSLDNLRPLQWENNCSKGDDYPTWTAVVAYKDGYNIHKKCFFTIE